MKATSIFFTFHHVANSWLRSLTLFYFYKPELYLNKMQIKETYQCLDKNLPMFTLINFLVRWGASTVY